MIRKSLPLAIAFALVVCVTGGKVLQYLHWNLEDSYIVYRIVRNILSGDGWSFNSGEIHNASTSVLNTVLITIFAACGFAVPLAGHIVTGLAIGSASLSAYFLFLKQFRYPVAVLSAVLVAVTLAENSSWGLETNLFLSLALLFVFNCRNELRAWTILGMATLARPDAILLATLYGFVQMISSGRISFRGPLVFLATLAPWIAFSLLQFGQVFPDTLSNKMWQGSSGFWGPGLVYLRGVKDHLLSSSFLYRAQLCLAVVGLYGVIRSRHPILYLLTFVALQQTSYVVLNVPAYHWYFGSLDFAVTLAALWAVGLFVNVTVHQSPTFARPAALVVAFGVCSWIAGNAISTGIAHPVLDSGNRHYEAAMALIARTDLPDGPIAAMEVGTVGYQTSRPIVDLTGLTSVNPEFLTGKHLDQFFAKLPPLVILHVPVWGMERALHQDPRFRYVYGDGIVIPTPYLPIQYFVAKRSPAELTPNKVRQYVNDHFPSFLELSSEDRRSNPVGVADCVLDAINEFPRDELRLPIDRNALLAVRGWAVDRSVPLIDTEVELRFVGEHGESYTARAARVARPDVARALDQQGYDAAGFFGEYDVQAIKPGKYSLSILLHRDHSTLVCAKNYDGLAVE
jgi:hypothetical protein